MDEATTVAWGIRCDRGPWGGYKASKDPLPGRMGDEAGGDPASHGSLPPESGGRVRMDEAATAA